MDRTSGANYIILPNGGRGFITKNAQAGIAGTQVDAVFLNGLQEELLTIILTAGETPDPNNWGQVLAGLQTIFTRLRIGGVPNLVQFTAPGSAEWTVPAYLQQFIVEVQGGGGAGGGGGTTNSAGNAGAGGDGGGYALAIISGVAAGTVVPVQVGAGGTPGASGSAPGNNGGTSSFGAFCSATGGQGGSAPSGNIGGIGPANPGYGIGGSINRHGGPGLVPSAIIGTSGSLVLQVIPGVGGAAGDGSPGAPGLTSATNPGAGGGGGDDPQSGNTNVGGSGAAGYVRIWS